MDAIEKTVPEAPAQGTPTQEVTRQPDRYAVPPVDIYEDEEGLVVVADLPGVTREGLTVQVELMVNVSIHRESQCCSNCCWLNGSSCGRACCRKHACI